MKNYFSIAALLGLIAFASVSFLAQAQQQQNNVAERAAAPAENIVAEEEAAEDAVADEGLVTFSFDEEQGDAIDAAEDLHFTTVE